MIRTTPARQSITAALPFTIEVHSVNYWAENFVFGLDDFPELGNEYTSYAISYWNHTTRGSSLSLALLALAHAIFGRTRHVHKAIEDANTLYFKAVKSIETDLTDLESQDIDQMIIALMLMANFDNVMWGISPHNARNPLSNTDEFGSRFCRNVCHYKGVSALLKLRQSRNIPQKEPIDRVAHRQLSRVSILHGKVPPDSLNAPRAKDEGPVQEFDAFMLRLAHLRVKSMHILQCDNSKADSTPDDSIAIEAQELDLALETWAKAVPDDWKFSLSPNPTGLASPMTDVFENCPIHTYKSHGHAAMWNRYRAARLIVNSILMRSLAPFLLFPAHFLLASVQQDVCQKNMEYLSTDLCGGVLFFFNTNYQIKDGIRVRSIKVGERMIYTEREILPKMAWLLAWPLSIAVSTEGVPELQEQFLMSSMKSVATALGDGLLQAVPEEEVYKF